MRNIKKTLALIMHKRYNADTIKQDTPMLNEKQRKHRDAIVELASSLIAEKYTAGALEHKTNLREDTTTKQLVDFAIEEAIDQVVYLLTLKQKMEAGE